MECRDCYDMDDEFPPNDEPCVEHDIRRAKMFLQKHSTESGHNLYDHLTELLAKILQEKPRNAVDVIEELSRKLKEERYAGKSDCIRDVYVPPGQYQEADSLIKLFQEIRTVDEQPDGGEAEEGEEAPRKKPNMLEFFYYLEQTGVGLLPYEVVLLNLAICKIMAVIPIQNVKFWGKILGNPKNYYVLEAELQPQELERRIEQQEEEERVRKAEEEEEEEEAKGKANEEAEEEAQKTREEEKRARDDEEEGEGAAPSGLTLLFPPMPINAWKPSVEVPPEKIGIGTNKKVYFVCNRLGLDEWVELPPVTPQQIVSARQIVRCCTGDLEAALYTFPPFSGTEKNYLRAQIARITASTHVSPVGYYTFGGLDEEDEVDEEVGAGDGELTENMHYDPIPVKELLDPGMLHWCHHSPYILKQGRVVWWAPGKGEDQEDEEVEEEEEEEDEEEEGAKGEPVKETSPPLLSLLSEDTYEAISPWSARQSSFAQPDTSVVLLESNVWPGAFTFASEKRSGNIYIGWACKHFIYNYSPPALPNLQDQYKIGPEIMEVRDPTAQDEEDYRLAHLPPSPILEIGEEEEGVEEEEEEEEEEDE